jgi:hypothetical protein
VEMLLLLNRGSGIKGATTVSRTRAACAEIS